MIPLTTKRVLQKLGGDKNTNKYTFDGNIEGKEVIQMSETMFAVKISDVPIPVSELKSVSTAIGEGKGTLSAKELYIENDEEAGYANIYDGNSRLPLAVIALKDVDLGMAVTKGIYVTMDKSIGLLVYAIEFNETIHPIEPKFLTTTINLDEYGIDLMSMFVAGGGNQFFEATGFWEKINEADGNVQFLTNVGVENFLIPSLKTYDSNMTFAWCVFGCSLMTSVEGQLVKADILFSYSSSGVSVTLKLA